MMLPSIRQNLTVSSVRIVRLAPGRQVNSRYNSDSSTVNARVMGKSPGNRRNSTWPSR